MTSILDLGNGCGTTFYSIGHELCWTIFNEKKKMRNKKVFPIGIIDEIVKR
jgi:hypothetical protein